MIAENAFYLLSSEELNGIKIRIDEEPESCMDYFNEILSAKIPFYDEKNECPIFFDL